MGSSLLRKVSGIALVLACLSGCGSSGEKAAPTTPPPSTVAVGVASGAQVKALKSQTSDGTSVVIAEVHLPTPGYVAVYADGKGAPGQLLGASGLLATGKHDAVKVELSQKLAKSGRVFVMLHVEDNGNQRFDFPKADRPVAADDGVMVTSVEIKVGS